MKNLRRHCQETLNVLRLPPAPVYRSASSSSGSGIWAASFISSWYCLRRAASTVAVGGARAGAATNSCTNVSLNLAASINHFIPKMGCQLAFVLSIEKASQNYNWTLPKYRSTVSSFFCGRL